MKTFFKKLIGIESDEERSLRIRDHVRIKNEVKKKREKEEREKKLREEIEKKYIEELNRKLKEELKEKEKKEFEKKLQVGLKLKKFNSDKSDLSDKEYEIQTIFTTQKGHKGVALITKNKEGTITYLTINDIENLHKSYKLVA